MIYKEGYTEGKLRILGWRQRIQLESKRVRLVNVYFEQWIGELWINAEPPAFDKDYEESDGELGLLNDGDEVAIPWPSH